MKTHENPTTPCRRILPAIVAGIACLAAGCIDTKTPATRHVQLTLAVPAWQLDPDSPLPASVTGCLAPIVNPGRADSGETAAEISPWPRLEVLAADGSTLAAWKASDPVSTADRFFTRTQTGEERAALFRRQLSIPVRQLFGTESESIWPVRAPAAEGAGRPTQPVGKPESSVPPPLPMVLAALKAKSGGEGDEAACPLLVFHPAGRAFPEAVRAAALPGHELLTTATEVRDRIFTSLPAASAEAANEHGTQPAARVLVWFQDPRPAVPPGDAPPAPVPSQEIWADTQPSPSFPSADKVNSGSEESVTGASPAPAQITNNFFILPDQPPANLQPELRSSWQRLVQGARPIQGAEFRFGFSSSTLDRENRAATRQWADSIAKMHPGKQIIVGGYSDDIGNWEQCQAIALRRAETVARILRERGLNPLVAGFGQSPPDRDGGPAANPADREKRRVVIIYVVEDPLAAAATRTAEVAPAQ